MNSNPTTPSLLAASGAQTLAGPAYAAAMALMPYVAAALLLLAFA